MDDIERILTLLQSEDPRQRDSAFDSIPASLPDQVTLALINTLRDDNLALRQRSVDTLIEKGSSSLPALIEALRIDDHDIQFNVIKVLGALGDQRATPHLIDLIEHAPDSLQYEIIEALVHLKDPEAVDTLITTLGNKEPTIRDLAAKGLTILSNFSLPSLFLALNSPQWLIRSYAARILGTIRNHQAVAPLVEVLPHSDSIFRKEVIGALGVLGDPKAVPALLRTLNQGEQETIQPLIESLAKINDPRSIPAMIEALKAEEWNKHEYIVDKIVSMGPQVVDHAIRYSGDTSPRIRIGVAKILGWFEQPEVTDALITLTRDADQEVRRITAGSLSQHHSEAGIRALVNLLVDPSNSISSQAAKSIIQLAPHSRPTLIAALRNPNPKIRRRAATLLCRKDVHQGAKTPFKIPPQATPYLMDCLQESREYTKYLIFLLTHIKGDELAVRIGFIYQRHPQMNLLIQELDRLNLWQHLSLLLQDRLHLTSHLDSREAKSIYNSLKEAAKNQRKYLKGGYCFRHFARFATQNNSGIEYMGCRNCTSTIFGIQAPSVHLILDDAMDKKMAIYPDRAEINRLAIKRSVDFEHVHIGSCDPEEIRSLCIEMGNDTEPYRRKAYATATCSVAATTSLDSEMKNLLAQHFRTVSYES